MAMACWAEGKGADRSTAGDEDERSSDACEYGRVDILSSDAASCFEDLTLEDGVGSIELADGTSLFASLFKSRTGSNEDNRRRPRAPGPTSVDMPEEPVGCLLLASDGQNNLEFLDATSDEGDGIMDFLTEEGDYTESVGTILPATHISLSQFWDLNQNEQRSAAAIWLRHESKKDGTAEADAGQRSEAPADDCWPRPPLYTDPCLQHLSLPVQDVDEEHSVPSAEKGPQPSEASFGTKSQAARRTWAQLLEDDLAEEEDFRSSDSDAGMSREDAKVVNCYCNKKIDKRSGSSATSFTSEDVELQNLIQEDDIQKEYEEAKKEEEKKEQEKLEEKEKEEKVGREAEIEKRQRKKEKGEEEEKEEIKKRQLEEKAEREKRKKGEEEEEEEVREDKEEVQEKEVKEEEEEEDEEEDNGDQALNALPVNDEVSATWVCEATCTRENDASAAAVKCNQSKKDDWNRFNWPSQPRKEGGEVGSRNTVSNAHCEEILSNNRGGASSQKDEDDHNEGGKKKHAQPSIHDTASASIVSPTTSTISQSFEKAKIEFNPVRCQYSEITSSSITSATREEKIFHMDSYSNGESRVDSHCIPPTATVEWLGNTYTEEPAVAIADRPSSTVSHGASADLLGRRWTAVRTDYEQPLDLTSCGSVHVDDSHSIAAEDSCSAEKQGLAKNVLPQPKTSQHKQAFSFSTTVGPSGCSLQDGNGWPCADAQSNEAKQTQIQDHEPRAADSCAALLVPTMALPSPSEHNPGNAARPALGLTSADANALSSKFRMSLKRFENIGKDAPIGADIRGNVRSAAAQGKLEASRPGLSDSARPLHKMHWHQPEAARQSTDQLPAENEGAVLPDLDLYFKDIRTGCDSRSNTCSLSGSFSEQTCDQIPHLLLPLSVGRHGVTINDGQSGAYISSAPVYAIDHGVPDVATLNETASAASRRLKSILDIGQHQQLREQQQQQEQQQQEQQQPAILASKIFRPPVFDLTRIPGPYHSVAHMQTTRHASLPSACKNISNSTAQAEASRIIWPLSYDSRAIEHASDMSPCGMPNGSGRPCEAWQQSLPDSAHSLPPCQAESSRSHSPQKAQLHAKIHLQQSDQPPLVTAAGDLVSTFHEAISPAMPDCESGGQSVPPFSVAHNDRASTGHHHHHHSNSTLSGYNRQNRSPTADSCSCHKVPSRNSYYFEGADFSTHPAVATQNQGWLPKKKTVTGRVAGTADAGSLRPSAAHSSHFCFDEAPPCSSYRLALECRQHNGIASWHSTERWQPALDAEPTPTPTSGYAAGQKDVARNFLSAVLSRRMISEQAFLPGRSEGALPAAKLALQCPPPGALSGTECESWQSRAKRLATGADENGNSVPTASGTKELASKWESNTNNRGSSSSSSSSRSSAGPANGNPHSSSAAACNVAVTAPVETVQYCATVMGHTKKDSVYQPGSSVTGSHLGVNSVTNRLLHKSSSNRGYLVPRSDGMPQSDRPRMNCESASPLSTSKYGYPLHLQDGPFCATFQRGNQQPALARPLELKAGHDLPFTCDDWQRRASSEAPCVPPAPVYSRNYEPNRALAVPVPKQLCHISKWDAEIRELEHMCERACRSASDFTESS